MSLKWPTKSREYCGNQIWGLPISCLQRRLVANSKNEIWGQRSNYLRIGCFNTPRDRFGVGGWEKVPEKDRVHSPECQHRRSTLPGTVGEHWNRKVITVTNFTFQWYRTSYRRISRSLESCFPLCNRCEIWQAPRQHCCRGACHIPEWHDGLILPWISQWIFPTTKCIYEHK